MASKKNRWRGRKGELQFKRVTRRYSSDNSPMGGDTLYIRIAGKVCCFVQSGEISDWSKRHYPGCITCHAGAYRIVKPVQAAHIVRQYIAAHV